jgi:hypothetical protein
MNSKPEGLSNWTILPLALRQYRVKVAGGPELKLEEQAVVPGAALSGAGCCPKASADRVNNVTQKVTLERVMGVSLKRIVPVGSRSGGV